MNRHNQGIAQILVILILIGLIALIAYYFLSLKSGLALKSNQAVQAFASPTPKSKSESEVLPDDTQDWKVFSDPKYGFSFKYPADAKLVDSPEGQARIVFMGQKQIASGRTQTELSDGYGFFVSVTSSTLSLTEAYQNRLESFKNVCDASNMTKPKTSEVGKKPALSYESSCLGDYTTYLVKNGDNLFEINELYAGESNDQIIYKKTSDKILSTFVFIK